MTKHTTISPAKATPKLSDKEADAMIAVFKRAPAMVTCDEMDQIEGWWESKRVTRRCIWATVTQPAKTLIAGAKKDREFGLALCDIAYFAKEIAPLYQRMFELTQAAGIRASMALLYRDDADELEMIATANRESEEPA